MSTEYADTPDQDTFGTNCGWCHNTGVIPTNHHTMIANAGMPCPWCTEPKRHLTDPDNCESCHGTGIDYPYNNYDPCRWCSGTGKQ